MWSANDLSCVESFKIIFSDWELFTKISFNWVTHWEQFWVKENCKISKVFKVKRALRCRRNLAESLFFFLFHLFAHSKSRWMLCYQRVFLFHSKFLSVFFLTDLTANFRANITTLLSSWCLRWWPVPVRRPTWRCPGPWASSGISPSPPWSSPP